MLGLGTSIVRQSQVETVENTTTNTNTCHFDGTGDYLTVGDQDDLSFSGTGNADDLPFSVAVWVKRDASSSEGLCVKGSSGANNLEYRIFWYSIGDVVMFDISDGTTVGSGYRRVQVADASTSWHHLIFTYNGTIGGVDNGMTIYRNGVKLTVISGGADTEGMTPSSANLIIGDIDSTGYEIDGELCQFIMWKNHEITQQEATYLYAGGTTHRNPTLSATDYSQLAADAVVLWLPLDANLNDASGNGYNSTASGNAALATATTNSWV